MLTNQPCSAPTFMHPAWYDGGAGFYCNEMPSHENDPGGGCVICGALNPNYRLLMHSLALEIVYKDLLLPEFLASLKINELEALNLRRDVLVLCEGCLAIARRCGQLCSELDRSVDVLRAKSRLRPPYGDGCEGGVQAGPSYSPMASFQVGVESESVPASAASEIWADDLQFRESRQIASVEAKGLGQSPGTMMSDLQNRELPVRNSLPFGPPELPVPVLTPSRPSQPASTWMMVKGQLSSGISVMSQSPVSAGALETPPPSNENRPVESANNASLSFVDCALPELREFLADCAGTSFDDFLLPEYPGPSCLKCCSTRLPLALCDTRHGPVLCDDCGKTVPSCSGCNTLIDQFMAFKNISPVVGELQTSCNDCGRTIYVDPRETTVRDEFYFDECRSEQFLIDEPSGSRPLSAMSDHWPSSGHGVGEFADGSFSAREKSGRESATASGGTRRRKQCESETRTGQGNAKGRSGFGDEELSGIQHVAPGTPFSNPGSVARCVEIYDIDRVIASPGMTHNADAVVCASVTETWTKKQIGGKLVLRRQRLEDPGQSSPSHRAGSLPSSPAQVSASASNVGEAEQSPLLRVSELPRQVELVPVAKESHLAPLKPPPAPCEEAHAVQPQRPGKKTTVKEKKQPVIPELRIEKKKPYARKPPAPSGNSPMLSRALPKLEKGKTKIRRGEKVNDVYGVPVPRGAASRKQLPREIKKPTVSPEPEMAEKRSEGGEKCCQKPAELALAPPSIPQQISPPVEAEKLLRTSTEQESLAKKRNEVEIPPEVPEYMVAGPSRCEEAILPSEIVESTSVKAMMSPSPEVARLTSPRFSNMASAKNTHEGRKAVVAHPSRAKGTKPSELETLASPVGTAWTSPEKESSVSVKNSHEGLKRVDRRPSRPRKIKSSEPSKLTSPEDGDMASVKKINQGLEGVVAGPSRPKKRKSSVKLASPVGKAVITSETGDLASIKNSRPVLAEGFAGSSPEKKKRSSERVKMASLVATALTSPGDAELTPPGVSNLASPEVSESPSVEDPYEELEGVVSRPSRAKRKSSELLKLGSSEGTALMSPTKLSSPKVGDLISVNDFHQEVSRGVVAGSSGAKRRKPSDLVELALPEVTDTTSCVGGGLLSVKDLNQGLEVAVAGPSRANRRKPAKLLNLASPGVAESVLPECEESSSPDVTGLQLREVTELASPEVDRLTPLKDDESSSPKVTEPTSLAVRKITRSSSKLESRIEGEEPADTVIAKPPDEGTSSDVAEYAKSPAEMVKQEKKRGRVGTPARLPDSVDASPSKNQTSALLGIRTPVKLPSKLEKKPGNVDKADKTVCEDRSPPPAETEAAVKRGRLRKKMDIGKNSPSSERVNSSLGDVSESSSKSATSPMLPVICLGKSDKNPSCEARSDAADATKQSKPISESKLPKYQTFEKVVKGTRKKLPMDKKPKKSTAEPEGKTRGTSSSSSSKSLCLKCREHPVAIERKPASDLRGGHYLCKDCVPLFDPEVLVENCKILSRKSELRRNDTGKRRRAVESNVSKRLLGDPMVVDAFF